jgi:hypothetical protein
VLAAAVGIGLSSSTATADAASCAPVHGYSTLRAIETHHVSCVTARRLLARWMRIGYPRNAYGGWFCDWTPRAHRVDGLCSAGNGGGAPYFTFHRYDSGE